MSVAFEDGKIVSVESQSAKAEHFHNSIILPGFIDLHTHGRLGQDTGKIDSDLLLKYARTGTTAFLPSFCKADLSYLMSWLDKAEKLKKAFQKEWRKYWERILKGLLSTRATEAVLKKLIAFCQRRYRRGASIFTRLYIHNHLPVCQRGHRCHQKILQSGDNLRSRTFDRKLGAF